MEALIKLKILKECLILCIALFFIHGTASYAQITSPSLVKKIKEVIIPPKKDSMLVRSVRGRIVDQANKLSLQGSTVILFLDSIKYLGTTANAYGYFEYEKVPVGRHTIRITHVGQRPYETSFMVDASNDLELFIELEEQVFVLEEIIKRATPGQINQDGGNKIRTDDLERLAGTRGEAIRKIAQVPGSQPSSDSRNDVVIRGNSPGSVLWRLNGVNIPNPNHFNIAGTAGGPVTFINDKMLGNASFYSGTFPAVYGNTVSGLFDLNFRSGDTTKFSGVLQFGVLGAEVSAKGPISKRRKSSYLFTFRKSAMAMFYKLGIDIGTEAIPYYRDASFNLNFPIEKGGNISVFGIGGSSDIDILVSQGHRNFYGEKDRDQYFQSATAITGINYKRTIDSTKFVTTTLAFSSERIKAHHDFVYPRDLRDSILKIDDNPVDVALPPVLEYDFKEKRILYALTYTKKLKRKGSNLFWGLNADLYLFNYFDSARATNESLNDFGAWRVRWNTHDEGVLLQPFIQWKFITKDFDVIAGIHSQYFSLSKSYSVIEPRVAVKYYLDEKDQNILNFGLGLHSQMQAPYLYFYGATNDELTNKPIPLNKNMDFTRSWHGVAGYEYIFNPRDSMYIRFKLEAYYQFLFNVPVDPSPSAFSVLNTGASFTRLYPQGELVNSGKGKNYGIELTIDKAFSKGYLFLITGSLFQSKYSGSDRIWRNTDLNGRYAFNALATREWVFKNQNVFSFGGRVTTVGGRWYGPVNYQETAYQKIVVYDEDRKNTVQFKPYYRLDFRISYKFNLTNVTHELAVDWINVLNTKNILRLEYQPDKESSGSSNAVKEYQLGMIPFFYWRMSF